MNSYISNHSEEQKSFQTIFAYIIKKGKVTRREIQRETNYSWGSVSSVVSLLIDKKYVIETESVHSEVGRGTTFIIPNGKKYVSIGVDINAIGFSMDVIGIDGSRKYSESFPNEGNNKEYITEMLFLAINKGLEFTKDKFEVISIGVSCQGRVSNHELYELYPFGKEAYNLNIKKLVEDKYRIFTYVDHDTNCFLEDYRFNHDSGKSVTCIARVVSGIGFSINTVNGVFNDTFPIDFGHMIVQPIDGALCICGRRGCLEAYSSSTGIISRAGVNKFSIIDQNRNKYRKYLDDAAFYLGIAAINIERTFDPDEIVFTGEVLNNDPEFFAKLVKTFNERKYYDTTEIKYISDLSASYGVARLAFQAKIIKL